MQPRPGRLRAGDVHPPSAQAAQRNRTPPSYSTLFLKKTVLQGLFWFYMELCACLNGSLHGKTVLQIDGKCVVYGSVYIRTDLCSVWLSRVRASVAFQKTAEC